MASFTFLFIGIGSLVIGSVLGYYARQTIAKKQINTAEARLDKLISDAKQEAKEIIISAKSKAVKALEDVKKYEREQQNQLLKKEELLTKREENINRRDSVIDRKEGEVQNKISQIRRFKKELESLKEKILQKLEENAKLTKEQAKEELFKKVENDYKSDLVEQIKVLEKNRSQELEKKALDIMTTAIQRYSRSQVADVTTNTVSLPDDELKGRIIGKEGRNIKTIERLTGVEIIVDETPEMITISGFDPIRREIAKIAIEKLITDGRIQPARIEEKVEEAKSEIKVKIKEAGESAVSEAGILDLPPQVIHLLGRLNFRTSYGQNVLLHSIEACHLAGMLAVELGANVEVAKKGALLHDIGKAVDHEIEGTHLELGRRILEKYGVSEEVIKAIEPHHEDYPFETPESYIVATAEAISAARPGARRDTVENYLKRLAELEKIANSFEGVEKSYAIQAGREIRVFVTPDKVDDLEMLKTAKAIANKIQEELKYPGEIKVNVIRETRAVEYAK